MPAVFRCSGVLVRSTAAAGRLLLARPPIPARSPAQPSPPPRPPSEALLRTTHVPAGRSQGRSPTAPPRPSRPAVRPFPPPPTQGRTCERKRERAGPPTAESLRERAERTSSLCPSRRCALRPGLYASADAGSPHLLTSSQAQQHKPASLSSESGESLHHVGCYPTRWGSRIARGDAESVLREPP